MKEGEFVLALCEGAQDKQDLLHAACGLVPVKGEVTLCGTRLNGLRDKARAELRKQHTAFVSPDALCVEDRTVLWNVEEFCGREDARIEELLQPLLDSGELQIVKKEFIMHREYLKDACNIGKEILSSYHLTNALSPGMAREEFRSRLAKELRLDDGKVVDDIIRIMEEDGVIRCGEKTAALRDFQIRYTPETEALRTRIYRLYQSRRFEFPSVDEVLDGETDKVNAGHVIEALSEEGKLIRLDYRYYMEKEAFEWALGELKKTVGEKGQITLAEFRDIIGTSRKYAMEILEYLDRQKITKKIDDARVLL